MDNRQTQDSDNKSAVTRHGLFSGRLPKHPREVFDSLLDSLDKGAMTEADVAEKFQKYLNELRSPAKKNLELRKNYFYQAYKRVVGSEKVARVFGDQDPDSLKNALFLLAEKQISPDNLKNFFHRELKDLQSQKPSFDDAGPKSSQG